MSPVPSPPQPATDRPRRDAAAALSDLSTGPLPDVTGRQAAAAADAVEVAAPRQPGVLGIMALAAVLLLLGMAFGASLWLYAAYAAFAMLGINRYLAHHWNHSMRATRYTGPLEVEVGTTVPIEIEIENTGRLPIPWLLAEDLLPRDALLHDPPALQVDGARLRVMLIPPGRRKSVAYRLTCNRRGYYQIGPTVLETGDLMGLNRRYRVGATPQYLLVTPRVVPLSGYEIASRRPLGEIRIRERLMDDPTRLQGIRQWQVGDSMRQIHWAATARTGTLHSKVYQQTALAGATLILDLHRDTNPASQEPVRSDLAVTLAASIAAALYQMNQPVGLVSNGRDAADRIRTEGWAGDYRTRGAVQSTMAMRDADTRLRPVVIAADRGPVHAREIQRQLARLELTDALSLASVLLETEPRLARDTTLTVILQDSPPESTAALLGMIRRGWSVAVVVNTYEPEMLARIAGPLIASGATVLHLRDEPSLAHVCREIVHA